MQQPPSDRTGPRAAALLAVLMVAWGLAIPVAPIAAAQPGWTAAVSSVVYVAGSLVCHQRADRSFATRGRPWPVCSRCAGIYLAGGVSIPGALVLRRRRTRGPVAASTWRLAVGAALAPIALTWLFERVGAVTFGNGIRAASGAALGVVVAVAVASVHQGRLGD